MFDIPFDVAVLSAGCLALAAGLGMSLVNLNASALWLRKWRVALAIGCAMSCDHKQAGQRFCARH